MIVVHVYWFLEYVLRIITQKYAMKYVKSFDSMLEFITVVPFLLLFPILGKGSYFVQFLIMLDNFRLFFYSRVTVYFIENETTIQVLNISMSMLIMIWTMACTLQFLENVNNYEVLGENLKELAEANVPVVFFDWIFFMCYTISLVGYGSYMAFDMSLIVILLILPVFFTVLPD